MTYVDQEPDQPPPDTGPPPEPPRADFGPSPLQKVAMQTPEPTPPSPTPPQTAPPSSQPPGQPGMAPPAAAPPPMQTPGSLQQQWEQPRQTDFQAYVPRSPKGYEHWGKPHWTEGAYDGYPEIGNTSQAAAPEESYGIIRGAGSQIGQWGSPATAPMAMAAGAIATQLGGFIDMLSGRGQHPFTSAFKGMETQSLAKQRFAMQSQREFMEMQRERMLDLTEAAVRRHRQEIEPARDIIFKWKNNYYSKNDDENLQRATQELQDWAATHHPIIGQYLANGGIRAAENQLNNEDAKYDDMMSGASSLRASDRRRREAGAAKGQPTDLDREWTPGGGEGGAMPRDASGQLIPQGPREQRAAPAAPAEPSEDLSEFDQKLAKDHRLSPSAVNAAHDIFRQGSVGGMTNTQMRAGAPKKFGDVISAAGDIDRSVRQAAAGPGTAEEKIEAIRKIEPSAAATIDGLRRYEVDPVSLHKNQGRDTAITRMVDPNYKPAFYRQAQKYKDPNTKEGAVMQRTATVPESFLALLDSLKDISETDNNFKRNLQYMWAEYYEGDPKYATVHQAIRNYLTDVVGVQMGTGTPRVTLINEAAKSLIASRSPAQIRKQAQVDLVPTFGMIEQVNRAWRRETGDQTSYAPLYDRRNAEMMDAQLRMNGWTGEVPADAPDRLKAVGKSKPTGKDRPSWLKPGQDFTPLDRKEVDKWRNWLKNNPNHPDAQQIREELRIVPDLRPDEYAR